MESVLEQINVNTKLLLPDVSHLFVLEIEYTEKGFGGGLPYKKMCRIEVTNAHPLCEQKYLINVVFFGKITACSTILSLQIPRVLDAIPRD